MILFNGHDFNSQIALDTQSLDAVRRCYSLAGSADWLRLQTVDDQIPDTLAAKAVGCVLTTPDSRKGDWAHGGGTSPYDALRAYLTKYGHLRKDAVLSVVCRDGYAVCWLEPLRVGVGLTHTFHGQPTPYIDPDVDEIVARMQAQLALTGSEVGVG